MKPFCAILLLAAVFTCIPLLAQEKGKSKDEAPSMTMPTPLTANEFCKWLVGEWEGTGTSPFGKTKEWEKVEWGLGNQFVMQHYTSKGIEMSDAQMKAAAEMMHMSMDDIKKMKDMTYEGMGPLTINPASGEYVGYWFDNWRGMYKGSGKYEGKKLTMNWEGQMGGEVRTVERVGDNKMVVTAQEKSPDGKVTESRSELTRK